MIIYVTDKCPKDINKYLQLVIAELRKKIRGWNLGVFITIVSTDKGIQIEVYQGGECVYNQTIYTSELCLSNVKRDAEQIFNNYIMKSIYIQRYVERIQKG